MTDVVNDLMKEFIELSFPISRMRLDKNFHQIKTKGNFKRVVRGWDRVYQISNNEQKDIAMLSLSIIIVRTFNVNQTETYPLLKKHLGINKSFNKV